MLQLPRWIKMTNIMQYLIQMSDEFRDSYEHIRKDIEAVRDKQDVLEIRMKELELNSNKNRQDEYNK